MTGKFNQIQKNKFHEFLLISLSTTGPRKENGNGQNIELKSTCHLALNECEREGACSRFLDQVKKMCDPITCDRNKCMRAIRQFYANIPERHSLDIAFCLCK